MTDKIDCTTPMTPEQIEEFFKYVTEGERNKRKERMTKG